MSQENEINQLQKDLQTVGKDAGTVWTSVINGISEPKPILMAAGEMPIAHKNSIILIQGKSGTHKSRLASIISALLIGTDKEKEIIGLTRNPDEDFSVLYVDTERNLMSQLPTAMKQIMCDAELTDTVPHFDLSVCPLINVNRFNRFKVLKSFVEQMKVHENRDGRHIVVVLDVITDCVSDFNQLGESYNLIDLMNSTINQEDVTFVCIIHENPGTDKARGHLGTELNNKASTVLQINESKQPGIFCIKTMKSRNTAKGFEVHVKFDTVTNNLVLVNDQLELSTAKEKGIELVLKQLGKTLVDETTKPDLILALKTCLGIKERQIDSKLKLIVDQKLEVETILGIGRVERITGRPVRYKIRYDDESLNG